MNINKSKIKFSALAASIILSSIILSSCAVSSENYETGFMPDVGVGREAFAPVQSDDTSDQKADSSNPQAIPSNSMVICIDPGHGFEDGGAQSDFLGEYLEKDITLDVSKKLKDQLEMLGYTVILTHDGETIPKTPIDDSNNKFNPQERVSFANSVAGNIDYFVSLHCNSYDSSATSGTRIYYYEGNAKSTNNDAAIAESIRGKIETNFPDSVKPTSENEVFYVVKYTHVPASLIEIGFMTNEQDAANMKDSDWQVKFAKSIADGIDSYFKENSAK